MGEFDVCLASYKRCGMTLIEVLAGIVLLSTLMALVVVAAGRFSARIRDSNEQLAAAHALDRQLAQWYSSIDRLPQVRSGNLAGDRRFRYRITQLGAVSDGLPLRRVRVEVFGKRGVSPLVTVELLERVPQVPIVQSGSQRHDT